MLDFLRNLLHPPERLPNIAPLVERGSRERERAARVVESLDRAHEQHVAERRAATIAETLLRARDRTQGR